MPIDYSKFDAIDDSDGEEDARHGGAAGAGSGGGANSDFEKLLRECLLRQAMEKDSAELSDVAAAGAAAGAGRGSVGRGVAGPPPPPPPPPPVRGAGRRGFDDAAFDDLDPFDVLDRYGGYDDGFGDDGFGDEMGSTSLDMEALRVEAWRLFCGRLVSLPGPAAFLPNQLLLEAEVHMMGSRYRQAIVAALAVQMATSKGGAEGSERQFGEFTAPTLVVEMVCSYQLGDRDRAIDLRDRVQRMDRSMLSAHLAKRFDGTAEVLDLVPQFLSFLQAAEKAQRSKGDLDIDLDFPASTGGGRGR